MYFDGLRKEIEAAAKEAFLEMHAQHGAEKIYAFALYSDEGAMSVCPATNTLKQLKAITKDDPDQADYYKFEPAEWKYEGDGADEKFGKICKALWNELEKHDDEEWFLKFQQRLCGICVDVLASLKKSNFFKDIVGEDIFLMFSVTEYEFAESEVREIVVRLNDNKYRDEYLRWMKTWGA
jgi:hypothetical protein